MSTATSVPRLRAIVLFACLAQFMVILDVSVVNVALPAIRGGLGFSEQNLQWVVSAYTVTFAGFMLLGGRAADLLGRRRVFVAGLGLFALASLAGGLAQSEGMLIAARALQGLGGAVIVPASLSILTTTFEEGPVRNRAVAIWGAMGGAGGAVGVLVGGLLAQLLGWRWILFINVPIGLAVAVFTHRLLPERVGQWRGRGFDLAGGLTATLGLTALVLGVVRTDVTGWGSPEALVAITAGVALLLAFVAIEGRLASAPLIPLEMFRSRTLSTANLVVGLIGGASFAMWFFVSLYLQQVLGYSPIKAGLAFLPISLGVVAGARLAPQATTRFGAKSVLSAGMLSQAAGLLLLARVSSHGSYLADVIAPSLLATIGLSAAFVAATTAATSGVASHQAGLASGLVNSSRLVGGAIGLAALTTLATARTDRYLQHAGDGPQTLHAALTSGFQLGLTLAAALALAGALVALAGLPRKQRAARSAPSRQPDAAIATQRAR